MAGSIDEFYENVIKTLLDSQKSTKNGDKIWTINIGDILNTVIEKLEEQDPANPNHIHPDELAETVTNIDFSKLSLVINGCVKNYSDKVDKLYQDVIQATKFLFAKTAAKRNANQDGCDVHHVDDDVSAFTTMYDIAPGKKTEESPDEERTADRSSTMQRSRLEMSLCLASARNKPFTHVVLPPVLMPYTDAQKGYIHIRNAKGEVVGKREDYWVNKSAVDEATGALIICADAFALSAEPPTDFSLLHAKDPVYSSPAEQLVEDAAPSRVPCADAQEEDVCMDDGLAGPEDPVGMEDAEFRVPCDATNQQNANWVRNSAPENDRVTRNGEPRTLIPEKPPKLTRRERKLRGLFQNAPATNPSRKSIPAQISPSEPPKKSKKPLSQGESESQGMRLVSLLDRLACPKSPMENRRKGKVKAAAADPAASGVKALWEIFFAIYSSSTDVAARKDDSMTQFFRRQIELAQQRASRDGPPTRAPDAQLLAEGDHEAAPAMELDEIMDAMAVQHDAHDEMVVPRGDDDAVPMAHDFDDAVPMTHDLDDAGPMTSLHENRLSSRSGECDKLEQDFELLFGTKMNDYFIGTQEHLYHTEDDLRVKSWSRTLQQELDKYDCARRGHRVAFDIDEMSRVVMDSFPAEDNRASLKPATTTLEVAAMGRAVLAAVTSPGRHHLPRMFLASLVLANFGNLDIVKTDRSEEFADKSNNITYRLEARDLHFERLSQYNKT